MNITNKEERLAAMQVAYMDNDLSKSNREQLHESWFNDDTIDYWRHERMYESIAAFAKQRTTASWLTIGDGRYGLDAIRLKKHFGLKHIFPTDISENMLKISKERGLIEDYKIENAERLSFNDQSYDVLFCKEAFHHFPRPYIALYEMLRVAKEAVVLVEPAERLIHEGAITKNYLLSAAKLLISKIFRKQYLPYLPSLQPLRNTHEEAGNYLYAVSVRELEKLIHGMDLGDMAYYYFNDYYIKGVEFEKSEPRNTMFEAIQKLILDANNLCTEYPQFHQPNMVAVILFKELLPEETKKIMKTAGFNFVNKVSNPYL